MVLLWFFIYFMDYSIDKGIVESYGNLDLFAKQVVEGFITGIHKSPFHGFSVEFAEHRLYNSGESVKNIDWKVFGRTDKLFVKKFEEETNLRCQVVIDNSSSMYYPQQKNLSVESPNKLVFATYAAAVIFNILKRQRDAFGLTLFSDKVDLHTTSKSSSLHYNQLITELEKLLKPSESKALKKTTLAPILHHVADSIHKRSLVIIFSDMIDSTDDLVNVLPALQHLKHNKHEVILFHVYDKKMEFDFSFDNRPYKFIDMENNEEIKLNPHDIKKEYIAAMQSFKDELYLKCGQYNVDIIQADINSGFKQILFPFFMKRQKLH